MKTTFIYTLADPDTNEIRYIGKANNPKRRIFDHIKESNGISKSHRISWIKSLLKQNKKPIIEILDEVPVDNWEFWEMYWISQFKAWGFNLTNMTPGGYNNSYRKSNETKQKISQSQIGKKLSEAHKLSISNGIKQKNISEPKYNIKGGNGKRIFIDKDELYQKYIVENLSLNKCALFFNASKKTLFLEITKNEFKKCKEDWKDQISVTPKSIINQYDLSGNFIKKWIGAVTIESELGYKSSVILNCCKGMTNKSYGSIWRFEGDSNIFRSSTSKEMKSIIQYDLNDNIINEFKSSVLASKGTNISRSSISYCCRGVLKSAGGFIWSYKV